MEEVKETESFEAEPSQEFDSPDEIAEAIEPEGSEASPAQPESGEEEQPLPEYPVPHGFDSEAWNGLSPDMRSAIHGREQAHAEALSKERAAVSQRYQETAQWAQAAQTQLAATMQALKQITEGEYAGIDWQGLSQSDPQTYVQLQQSYQRRMAEVKKIQDGIAKQYQGYQQMMQAQRSRVIASELNQAVPRMQALLGAEFEPAKLASDVANYLSYRGVPKQAINSMSRGYELELATKAMLYDRMQAARSVAQRKISEAPVASPSGRSDSSNSSRYQRAKALLAKNSSDTDALAAVFESM